MIYTLEEGLQIEIVHGDPCYAEVFKINGIEADIDDFGESKDVSPEIAEHYGCGCRRFITNPPTQDLLEKYGLSETQYYDVCYKLQKELFVGKCGWCV